MVLTGILKRDHAYILVVASSIVIGGFIRRLNNAFYKKTLSAATGFLITFLFCGLEMLHSLSSIVIGVAMIKLIHHSSMPRLVFAVAFLYRIFFCMLTYSEVWRNENTLANGIQLVVTIKLISAAYEIGEYRKKHSKVVSNGHCNGIGTNSNKIDSHKTLPLLKEPSTWDVICYMYCFLGISTGPFFRLRTFQDMIRMPKNVANEIPALSIILSRIPMFLVLILLSTALDKYFPSSFMKSDEFFNERSCLYRFCYVIPIGLVGMSRYGVVWFLSEFGFTMAGLGVYPESRKSEPGRGPSVFSDDDVIWPVKESPKPVKYDTEAIRSVYVSHGFTSHSYAKTFRYWNCSVQWWLAHFIYASKLFSGKPALVKWIAVAVVSAVWHGFKAGYYFSFVGMVYIATSEQILLDRVGDRLTGYSKTVFIILHYFLFKVIGIGSFMTTFVLSSYEDVLRYLSSIYFGVYSIATISLFVTAILSVLNIPKEYREPKAKTQ